MKYSDNGRAPAEFYYIYLDFRYGTDEEIKAFDQADKDNDGLISENQYRLLLISIVHKIHL